MGSQRVAQDRVTNMHTSLNADGGLDWSSQLEVSVGAGCQLRCLSSSRRQAPASSHSEFPRIARQVRSVEQAPFKPFPTPHLPTFH